MWSGRFISTSQMRWLSLKAVKVETRAHGSTVHTQDHWVLQTRVLTFFLICLFTCSGFQSSITTELQQSPLTLQPSTPTAWTSFVLFLCWDRLSTTSLKIRVTCHALHFSINQNFVSPSYSQKQFTSNFVQTNKGKGKLQVNYYGERWAFWYITEIEKQKDLSRKGLGWKSVICSVFKGKPPSLSGIMEQRGGGGFYTLSPGPKSHSPSLPPSSRLPPIAISHV